MEFYLVVVYESDGSSAPKMFASTNPDDIIKLQERHAFSRVSVYKTAPKNSDSLFIHLSGPNLFILSLRND